MVNNMKKIIVFLICLLSFVNVKADNKVYVFYGNECPVCKKTEEYLETKNYEIIYYETWENEENNELLKQIIQKFQDKTSSVPYIVIGNKRIIGYSAPNKEKIDYLVKDVSCDLVESIINKTNKCQPGENLDNKIKVSFLGYVDSSKVLLGIIVIFIAIINGLDSNQIKEMNNLKDLTPIFIINLILLFIVTTLSKLINNTILLIIIIICSLLKKIKSKTNNKILNICLNFINTLNISLIFIEIIKLNNIKNENIYILLYVIFQVMPSIIIYIYTFLKPNIKKEIKYYNIIIKIVTIIIALILLFNKNIFIIKKI